MPNMITIASVSSTKVITLKRSPSTSAIAVASIPMASMMGPIFAEACSKAGYRLWVLFLWPPDVKFAGTTELFRSVTFQVQSERAEVPLGCLGWN
jgi:hypothetical protein